ncbi:DUF5996 family protein [uncultured Kriegella sp.]|uniref:DUF5996 family protein n=1 Tax=uncultured Kriegella sp. TaxID=1798910 RepID=UPI0030D944D6|tara:strand:- start:52340 stop:53266 length:927 start_codon:yes stop_codon:yes gene_type:complete
MKNILQLPLLPYAENVNHKLTLHLLLQIVGKIRLKMTPRKNHWWYITEYISTQGISTGPIPYHSGLDTFTITINVHTHRLEVITSKNEVSSFSLIDITVAGFYDQLMEVLKKFDIHVTIVTKPFDLNIDKHFGALTEYHHYSETYTKNLWQVLLWVDGVFKEFGGRFYGKTCPVHLYWHSMDLAVTRFSGNSAPPMGKEARLSDKDAYSHECISFGFWAGDENMKEPAFYSYTYPAPEGINEKELQPSTAEWIDSNGSPMAILRYNDLLNATDPRQEVLNFLESAYRAGAELADWDTEKLDVPALHKL